MRQIGRIGTNPKKKRLQLHPFLSMHDPINGPKPKKVRMNKMRAVLSETSMNAASQQKSGFLPESAIVISLCFYVFNY